MLTDYRCAECSLGLRVGTIVFESSHEGYDSETLSFCKRCGTIHSLLHPPMHLRLVVSDERLGVDAQAGEEHQRLPDRESAQSGPLSVSKSPFPGCDYRVPLGDWKDVETDGRCAYCGATGPLCFEAVRVECCPRCGSKNIAKICSWHT